MTTARTPGTVRAASSRLTVPITLVSYVARGSANERRTIGCAAMWMITSGSQPAVAAATASGSRMSPVTFSIPSATPGQLVERGVGGDAVGEAGYAGAERLQPERQPGPLEAGVAGQEDAPPVPEGALDRGVRGHESQSRQGGEPESQSSSRIWRSRIVSIGCQKPWWR